VSSFRFRRLTSFGFISREGSMMPDVSETAIDRLKDSTVIMRIEFQNQLDGWPCQSVLASMTI
jgi:hypothetical protein